jgi:hypothetical protein
MITLLTAITLLIVAIVLVDAWSPRDDASPALPPV